MKTMAEIRNVLATANNKELFNSSRAAEIVGIPRNTLINYISYHKELRPSMRTQTRQGEFLWTKDEIIRFAEYRARYLNCKTSSVSTAATTATPESAPAEDTVLATVNPDNPFSILKAMNKACEQDSNFKAMMKLRSEFEHMNEQQLQIRFSEMLKRFKFKYITENVKSVQSQTLTCIAKGKLRGIDRYKLSFNSYLELLEFCYNNSCPVAEIQ